jgi:glutathione peroxidase-family protein
LQQAYTELRDQGFVIIGVNLTESEAKNGISQAEIAQFIEQYGVTYPIALDVESSVTNAYRVFPLPTSFFVDGQGTVRFVKTGELTKEDVTATFLELQGEATVPSR